MYKIDKQDRLTELTEIPPPSTGAPEPILLASRDTVVLAYLLDSAPNGRAPSEAVSFGGESGPPVAIVHFQGCLTHMVGPPNDEALAGHPLVARGLEAYSVFEVHNSSWLRSLESLNSLHSKHDKARFLSGKRHFIFTFHDETFECIAEKVKWELGRGTRRDLISHMSRLLE